METALPITISLVLSYLLGAIPTGYLCGRLLKGLDIREHGSKNMGATNVFRVLGKGPGAAVLLIDIAKGIVPTTVFPGLFDIHDPLLLVILGVVAVAGHNWTVFLKFKGGKGVATTLGVLIGWGIQMPVIWPVLGFTVGVWLVVFLLTGFVSLASILASIALPLGMVCFYPVPFPLRAVSIVLCVLVVFKHRANMSRLLKGQENRIKLPFHK